jgi:hypothetical protein
LGDPLPATQLGDRVFTPNAFHHDPNLVFGAVLAPRLAADILNGRFS